MAKIFILGAGFGTALAVMTNRCGHNVFLWSPYPAELDAIRADKQSKKLLPGVEISSEIKLTSDLLDVSGADLCIIAVPSFAIASVCENLSSVIDPSTIVVNVAKGFSGEHQKRLSEVIDETLPNNRVVVLSGPSHAEEVAREIPTTIVASSKCRKSAELVQDILMNETLRIYINDDLIGVELGGGLKNIIALAAGICDGMGLGDNTKAALMTRGLTEIARLGVAMGAREQTFAGLSGVGDLIVTCTSLHSRNRRAGILIGQGTPPLQAVETVGTVEGYSATKSAAALAERFHVQMPITAQLYQILFGGVSVINALKELMERPKANETEHIWMDRI